jgi:hypothetical protein
MPRCPPPARPLRTIASIAGIMKAIVLPLPVFALASTSWPTRQAGIAFSCTGLHLS